MARALDSLSGPGLLLLAAFGLFACGGSPPAASIAAVRFEAAQGVDLTLHFEPFDSTDNTRGTLLLELGPTTEPLGFVSASVRLETRPEWAGTELTAIAWTPEAPLAPGIVARREIELPAPASPAALQLADVVALSYANRTGPSPLKVLVGTPPVVAPTYGDWIETDDALRVAQAKAGREEFEAQLFEDSGLGPLFNDHSCAICHLSPVVGGFSDRLVTHFGRAGLSDSELRELGGPILQAQGIRDGVVEFVPPVEAVVAERITPHLFGIGLVEALTDDQLRDEARSQDPRIRGRWTENTPLEGGPARVGRLGWKNQFATLLSFTADASLEEMGLTSEWLPVENAPAGDRPLVERLDAVPDPEIRSDADGTSRLTRLVEFQRRLAPPPQAPLEGLPGERVFVELGCAACHLPSWTVAPDAPSEFAGITFRPYSDFLLHDMGASADGLSEAGAEPSWMRTAPLWGLAGRQFLWHDGRVQGGDFESRITQAIEWHAGQGESAKLAFGRAEPREHSALFEFLRSLGRPYGDLNDDGSVDEIDRRLVRLLAEEETLSPQIDPAGKAATHESASWLLAWYPLSGS